MATDKNPLAVCGLCGRRYDMATWSLLHLVGVMRDEVECIELRNCSCNTTLAIEICSASGCPIAASWQAEDERKYCEGHSREFLMAEDREEFAESYAAEVRECA